VHKDIEEVLHEHCFLGGKGLRSSIVIVRTIEAMSRGTNPCRTFERFPARRNQAFVQMFGLIGDIGLLG
jgi:hypothetical protein